MNAVDNGKMEIVGRIQNGVVVFESPPPLPEGAEVTVHLRYGALIRKASSRRRIEMPLVASDQPGSLELTGERIAEILEAQDVEALKGQEDVPS